MTFYSPGTFVAETTEKPIDSWDVEEARKMAAKISERYGATPYAFEFSTRRRSSKDLDSKVVKTSGKYYINCKVRTLAEVKKDNDPKEEMLRSNMEINKIKRIVTTIKGWRWSQALTEGDVVL